jgi:hypothetical protein
LINALVSEAKLLAPILGGTERAPGGRPGTAAQRQGKAKTANRVL